MQATIRGAQGAHDLVERLEIARDHPVVADFAAALAMKEQALAKTTPLNGRPGRYRPGDQLLRFLNGL
jgi:hypothetical protein